MTRGLPPPGRLGPEGGGRSGPEDQAPAFGERTGGLPRSFLEPPSFAEHRLPDLLAGPQLPLQVDTPPPPSPRDGAATVPSFVNLVNHAPSLTVSHAPSLTASRPDGFAPGFAPSLYPGSSSSGLAGHALGGLLRGMAGFSPDPPGTHGPSELASEVPGRGVQRCPWLPPVLAFPCIQLERTKYK